MNSEKTAVQEFWNQASCGETLYLSGTDRAAYQKQADIRYRLEPFIRDFACFHQYAGQKVLEIGVGLGADHQKFAEAGALMTGIDLTRRAVEHTRGRFEAFNLSTDLRVSDAEELPFDDATFDLVYSWGVLHHSPDTPRAIAEVHRVLRAGGAAKIMIYHKVSLVGFMLWCRYALMRLRPWLSLREIYSRYLESPGTKAYSLSEARQMFAGFREVQIRTVLTHGDLLESQVGQRHNGVLLSIARKIWPRALLKRYFASLGLFMLVDAKKCV